MKRIPLSNGGFTIVDDADFDFLTRWKWRSHSNGYVVRSGYRDGRMIKILMHRLLMGEIPVGYEVDHINRDRKDNRRSNLRVVTHAVNQRNCGLPRNNTSGFKGVCWDKHRLKWVAKTKHDNRHVLIGRFDSIEEAHKAYEKYMVRLGR